MVLPKFFNILHQPLGNIICSCLKIAFSVYPYDGFSIGCTQMNPVCIKFDLQPVFRINGLFFIL